MSLTAIQAYIRTEAARSRETDRIGPFLATVNDHNANPYLSYAIPDDGADPSSADVAALVAFYTSQARKPRLEYLPAVAPAVEAALLAGGFAAVEGRLPLMVCAPGAERAWPAPHGIDLVMPRTDAEVRDLIAAQNEAYGEGEPSQADVARFQGFLAAGGIAVLARDAATGIPAGGGICTVPHNGAGELAGLGVRPAFRRRGTARALTARLTREAFAAGVTAAFLTPAGETEARIYTRCGSATVAEVLHIARPL